MASKGDGPAPCLNMHNIALFSAHGWYTYIEHDNLWMARKGRCDVLSYMQSCGYFRGVLVIISESYNIWVLFLTMTCTLFTINASQFSIWGVSVERVWHKDFTKLFSFFLPLLMCVTSWKVVLYFFLFDCFILQIKILFNINI